MVLIPDDTNRICNRYIKFPNIFDGVSNEENNDLIVGFIPCIEDSELACDTGGHFTNYPTWPLPRTNPNVNVLNNSLNYYAFADLMLYRLSVNIKHITLCLQTF